MSIRFDYEKAAAFLLDQAQLAAAGEIDPAWIAKIERLSELCERAGVRTHIAFLGTVLLARSLNPDIDPYTVKPTHARDPSRSYPARTLAEKVLVPMSIRIGMHLGVTGREPLNNQPYFRMRWLGDDTPISGASKPPFEFMMTLIAEIADASAEEARQGLRAFIAVRRQYATKYATYKGIVAVELEDFAAAIAAFVAENSENGKRAQAVVAGLIDLVESPGRVLSGRINDPSRRYPGDVCVVNETDPSRFEKAFEVRDKPVSESDIFVFADTCLRRGVQDVAVVMLHPAQKKIDETTLTAWGRRHNVAFRLFYGWRELVMEALFWASVPMRAGVSTAADHIERRLREVEVSDAGYQSWGQSFRTQENAGSS